ncbi:hypothetical protein [Persicobacter psychrovividus]|uniref:Uncharacterized protein n=1 Tax=Persicobacter psychrovividus TaxID=387638 RepID=A0ABM7VGC5_9BACT|nr:hypothetical protein PEPS_23070 [Persicobacter psychrovividus]
MNFITHESLHQRFKGWISNIDFWQSEIRFFKKQQELILAHSQDETHARMLNELAHHQRLLSKLRQIISAHSSFYCDYVNRRGEFPDQAIGEEDFHESEKHLQVFKRSYKKLKERLRKRSLATA